MKYYILAKSKDFTHGDHYLTQFTHPEAIAGLSVCNAIQYYLTKDEAEKIIETGISIFAETGITFELKELP